jgi:hypothetical protein
MYQKIKTELQLFFVLVIVAVGLFLWSTTLRPELPPAAGSGQILEANSIALLEAADPAGGSNAFQTGSPANPIHLFEPSTHFQGTGANKYYIPIVRRSSILYFDNFSDDDSGWPEYDTSDCFVQYNSSEYRIEVKEDSDSDDDECFGPAPEDAEFELGDFSVKFRRTDGSRHYNAGIYINGDGGGEYYLFRVEHDDDECDWRLVRRKDDDDSTKRSGVCDSISNGYNQTNTLRIRRINNQNSDGVITVYLNGDQLGSSYTDTDQLDGEGAGVFANEETNEDKAVVRFDDFTVRKP